MRSTFGQIGVVALVLSSVHCVRAEEAVKPFPDPATDLKPADGQTSAEAVLAGGCFWCTEAVFEGVPGVTDVVSGYAGGSKEDATYQKVSAGETGHAEAIRVRYDPAKVSFGQLLKVFFATAHNPTQLNRQGPDVGRQYRSAIFFADDEQKRIAEAYIKQLTDAKVFQQPIVTTLEKLDAFYPAEDYHQDYAQQNPDNSYVRQNVPQKVKKRDKLLEKDK